MTAAERLAQFAVETAEFPEAVRREAVLHLLDTLGCALAASGLGAGLEAHELAATGGDAEVIARVERAPARDAALANGVVSHALDFDDTHADSVCHVSVVVCPAALAVAQAEGRTGRELVEAIVAGYETTTRIGMAASSAFHERGFHPTAVCGVFGAAAASARLLGLDTPATTKALGIVGSFASGIFEYLSDGSNTKPLHAGWAAQAGVTAALLARAGARGPASVLEGRFGFYSAFLGRRDVDIDAQLDDLGERWETPRIAYKLYPACHYMHGVLGAAAEVMRERSLRADEIAALRVAVPGPGVALVLDPLESKWAPRTTYDAKFSLPYSLARLILDGRLDLAAYAEDAIASPEVLALARRVRYEERDFPTYPEAFPGWVEFRLQDGTIVDRIHEHQVGGPERPVSETDVREKFLANARLSLPADRAERQAERVLTVEELEDVRCLLEPVAVPV